MNAIGGSQSRETGRLIEALDVHKAFGDLLALKGVTLRVGPGACLGVVGPNGAGKTTLLRLLAGLLAPDHGTVSIAGADPYRSPEGAGTTAGYLLSDVPLFDLLSGREHLTWTAEACGLSRSEREARIDELAGALELTPVLDRMIVTYSSGTRRKLAFANAVVTDPRIIVMDEPFEGVDAIGSMNMRSILKQFAGVGAAVVVTSHVLPLVEELCDRVLVLVEGRIVASGSIEELRASARGEGESGGALERLLLAQTLQSRPVALRTIAQAGRPRG